MSSSVAERTCDTAGPVDQDVLDRMREISRRPETADKLLAILEGDLPAARPRPTTNAK